MDNLITPRPFHLDLQTNNRTQIEDMSPEQLLQLKKADKYCSGSLNTVNIEPDGSIFGILCEDAQYIGNLRDSNIVLGEIKKCNNDKQLTCLFCQNLLISNDKEIIQNYFNIQKPYSIKLS